MHQTLIAVDHDMIAVQRLVGDALCVDHQRDCQRTGNDGGVAADRAFFQNDALQLAPVFQQLARADVARDQDRIVGHLRAGLGALAGQDAQQAVRQVVKVVQPVAQVGIGDLAHPGAGRGLLLLHSGLG